MAAHAQNQRRNNAQEPSEGVPIAQSAPPQFRNNHNQMVGEQVVRGIPQQATLGVLGEP